MTSSTLAVGDDAFLPALRRLAGLRDGQHGLPQGRFDPARPVVIGRAPGRLDVMGGIADYSGSVVLQLPLALATFVLLQRQDEPRVEVVSEANGGERRATMDLGALLRGPLTEPAALRAHLESEGASWATYVLGVVQRCFRLAEGAGGHDRSGLRLLILSQVPEGSGVSSSAALEVATMVAVAAHLGVDLSGQEVAEHCQWVENHVVGAPCGIMDQLTSALGRPDRLLRIRCQPAAVEGHVAVPADFRFFGIDSGVRHAVSGADYGTVRAAAFMGYRIIAELAGIPVREEVGRTVVDDARWGGYLANLTPAEFARYAPQLPEWMDGADFLRRYGAHLDHATEVRAGVRYPVRVAAAHPVMENDRVERFAALLPELGQSPEAAVEMGALMYASHASYGACGLGSPATDRIVERIRTAGAARGLFGARITGGGSGGTVAVLARAEAEEEVRAVAAEVGAGLFAGSGPGADVRVIPGGG